MKKITPFILSVLLCCAVSLYGQDRVAPKLVKKDKFVQLIADGKPFLILGGELGNSTASSIDEMRSVWPHMQSMGLNTVLVPVYWELMEPQEGVFDFLLIDDHITQARKHDQKIIFLWFGAWKNSMSCYAPAWVKTNAARFERTVDPLHAPIEILSVFGEQTLQADKKAFAALMKHIKQTDEKDRTVIMVQVENEIGMLGSAREITQKAEKAFNQPVPAELMNYLIKYKSNLLPELENKWKEQGYKTSGNWKTVFGESLATDEMFQAWHYAKYTEAVTAAGKAEYNIPMYVNAALFRKDQQPGSYPSAGPLPQVMEIWQVAAPSIDILSPDIYNPDTEYWCSLYSRKNNTLFIPEIRFDPSTAAKALFVMGHYEALGFSPFAIESRSAKEENPLKKSYDILRQLYPLIIQGNKREGVLVDKQNPVQKFRLGDYQVSFSHDGTFRWSSVARDSVWDITGGIIIQVDKDEFLVGGTGIIVTFDAVTPSEVTNILSIDEGRFENNVWKAGRRLNGDESHQGRHLRIPINAWGLQRIKLYKTKM